MFLLPTEESYRRRKAASRVFISLTEELPGSTVGERIKEARVRLGKVRLKRLTQEWLAAQVGVSPGTVAKWETDVQRPGAEALVALSRVLGPPPRWFLTGTIEEESAEDAVYNPGEVTDERPGIGEEEIVQMPQVVRHLKTFDGKPDAGMLKLAAVRVWGEILSMSGGWPAWYVALREKVERGEL